ncbi:hypothetical protein BKH41_04125 [Helicobacter sp. 12S02232-10]|uniref:hypothetical protein n=1 Tax=Helicobacter sp. 12S02232-10 TaxID=1476197 RepID=UPI000BA574BE|nr:hypothetical protein [Helicobacter sp. 12S02232-10]PAF48822.1 hypothetical protein BKH41_04125 [Helicobacter sp. 12S02232-10]
MKFKQIKSIKPVKMTAKLLLFTITMISFISFNACSDKYYEMYQSPCACFEDIKKLKELNKNPKSEEINNQDPLTLKTYKIQKGTYNG